MARERPAPTTDFRLLWGGQTVSEIGSRITREGLPLTAVLVLGATPAQMGVLAATGGVAVLAVGLAAGVIVDRHRRRPLMIGADVGRALLLASIPVAAFLHVLTFTQLLAIALFAGVLTVTFDVAYRSYLPSLVPPDQLMDGNRRLAISSSVAEVVGPAATGVLVQALTAPIAILIDAVSFVVSAVSLGAIRTPEPDADPGAAGSSLWRDALAGARTIAAHGTLRALAYRSVLAYFGYGVLGPQYILYAIRVLHLSPSVLGVLIAIGGAGALSGSYFADRLTARLGVGGGFVTAAIIIAAAAVLIPLASHDLSLSVVLLGVSQFLGDNGFALYTVNEITIRQRVAPPDVLGRVNAAMELASRGVMPVGALVSGALAQAFGVVPTLWAGALIVFCSCFCLIPLLTPEPVGSLS